MLIDLTGLRFGRLLVIGRSNFMGKDGKPWWDCVCDCGNSHRARGTHLKNGNCKSCKCFRKDFNTKHGKSKTKIYETWFRIIAKCNNPKNDKYKWYGGRGIKVNSEWLDFNIFYRDMGDRPDGMTIERIDVNGNYCRENCKWATQLDQARNKRNNIFIEFKGERLPIGAFAKRYGLAINTVHSRLKMGWSIEKSLLTPIKTIYKKIILPS